MYENDNNNVSYQVEATPVPPATTYAPVPPVAPVSDPALDAMVDDAFGKSLAAAIMAEFPVASIIAISFGINSLDMLEQARVLAAQRGAKLSGKAIATKILGMIGKIAGIAMTVFWAIYLTVIFFAAIGAAF